MINADARGTTEKNTKLGQKGLGKRSCDLLLEFRDSPKFHENC